MDGGRYREETAQAIDLASRPGFGDDIQRLIRGIPGFIAYNLVRCEGGGFSMSVFDDRKGAEESVRIARDYVRENFPDVGVAPQVFEGEAVISFSA